MGRSAGPTLKLINDISKVGADRLLIHAEVEAVKYFNGNTPVDPAEERTKFIGISQESVLDAIRMLAGEELVDGFLSEVNRPGMGFFTNSIRETVVNLDGERFRLTFTMKGGKLVANFLLLDTDRTSKWQTLLDDVSPDFLGGTKLRMGNRYGSAELELSATQLTKVKAFLLELEQENFAPAAGEPETPGPERAKIDLTPDMWDKVKYVDLGDFRRDRKSHDVEYVFVVGFEMFPLATGTVKVHRDGSLALGHGTVNRSKEAAYQGRQLEEMLNSLYRHEWRATAQKLAANHTPVKIQWRGPGF